MASNDSKFWDFSWHEIGIYDVPATIDYILKLTNQTKLAYAGVSQGGAVILVTLSELPEYNEKISLAQLMAPAVLFKYFNAPFPKSVDLINLFGVSNIISIYFSQTFEVMINKGYKTIYYREFCDLKV